jgi:hypothetical protein
VNLTDMRAGELLGLSRSILAELRQRGVIRTGNAPAGDYAELLVRVATGGELAPNSQKSWDVLTPAAERLQVKARVVTNPRTQGERQLSVFRSWDFDAVVIVLFDDGFGVWRAVRVPVAVATCPRALRRARERLPHHRARRTTRSGRGLDGAAAGGGAVGPLSGRARRV